MNNNYLDSLTLEVFELSNGGTVVHGKLLVAKNLLKEETEKALDEYSDMLKGKFLGCNVIVSARYY